jgi:hypothetical protein
MTSGDGRRPGTEILSADRNPPTRAGIIGGIVGIVLIYVPGSAVIAGGISSYLTRSTNEPTVPDRATVKSGSVAGLTVMVPTYALYVFFIVFVLGRAGESVPFLRILGEAIVGFGVLFVCTVGLSLLGAVGYRRPR